MVSAAKEIAIHGSQVSSFTFSDIVVAGICSPYSALGFGFIEVNQCRPMRISVFRNLDAF